MLQSIITKYKAPSAKRPASRIVATGHMRGVTPIKVVVDVGHLPGPIDVHHVEAARQLAQQLGWSGQWQGGSLDPESRVFVRIAGGAEVAGFRIE
jgi:hypothetical protein